MEKKAKRVWGKRLRELEREKENERERKRERERERERERDEKDGKRDNVRLEPAKKFLVSTEAHTL